MQLAERHRTRLPGFGGKGLGLGMAALCLAVCVTSQALQASESPSKALSADAAALRAEILDLQVSFTGLARRVRAHEQALVSAEDTLAKLERTQAEKLEELARRRQDHYRTLAALQRIALHPRTAVAVSAERPLDALRGALLLKAAVPALDEQAAELRLALEELDGLRYAILEERRNIAAASVALEQQRQAVALLIARKKNVLAVTEAELEQAETRAATLARQAADLRELMTLAVREDGNADATAAGVEADAATPQTADEDDASPAGDETLSPGTQVAVLERPDTIRSFPADQGHILLPVAGQIVHRFGEHSAAVGALDPILKGIKIRCRPGAEVVAPYDGKVVYAGAFRSYGQILIIDHGGQYHTLLAGLHRIRAVVGQWVLAGEPVATMTPQDDKEPELYLELRRTGQPINPLPWLAEGEQKARG
ncbi:MAG TPA: peptidoglycan DD-metalloendopeptidase family protein [Kiloniellaceae bacterium]|nr:peptidoglycan DD-metalloendopeptidase family protein [Kiloniellaceae bacterium]